MEKKNFFVVVWGQITRWVLMKYLSGKISPHALLAARSGIKFDHTSSQEPYSENFECNFPPVRIYSNSKGEKFVAVPLGFVSLESYSSSVKLRELSREYNSLLIKYNNLFLALEEEKNENGKLDDLVGNLNRLVEKLKLEKSKLERGPSYDDLLLKIARLEKDLKKAKEDCAEEKILRTKLELSNSNGIISKEKLKKILKSNSSSPEKQIGSIRKLIG